MPAVSVLSRASEASLPRAEPASARALVAVETQDSGFVPERLVFGKAWLDSSGITFARNDLFEVQAVRTVSRIRHVFPFDSFTVLIGAKGDPKLMRMLSLVPAALDFVPSLAIGAAFPQPLRTNRPLPPSMAFVRQALLEARSQASACSDQTVLAMLDMLTDSGGRFDPDGIAARLVGLSPDKVRTVLSGAKALMSLVEGHAAIAQAVRFQDAWAGVCGKVEDLHQGLSTRYRWLNNMLSHSIRLLQENGAQPIARLSELADRANSHLSFALRARAWEIEPERVAAEQFAIWRNCRRLVMFYEPLARLWDAVDLNSEQRAGFETLVRSTICRLQSFKP